MNEQHRSDRKRLLIGLAVLAGIAVVVLGLYVRLSS
jgi:hypothetical protein